MKATLYKFNPKRRDPREVLFHVALIAGTVLAYAIALFASLNSVPKP